MLKTIVSRTLYSQLTSIKTDIISAQPHRIPDGGTDFFQTKVFEEPQDLDILAGTGLPHSCLEQPPEVNKLLGQLPAFERCCLLECSGLAFQQRQIMQWMEDQLIAAMNAGGLSP